MARPGVDPQFADPRNFDGYWPPDWDARQQLVVRRDNWSCTNCDTTDEPQPLCTIPEQPIEQGGSFELSNLITLCEDCKNEFQQSSPSEHEQSEPSHQSQPEHDHTSSRTQECNGQPTAEDTKTRSDAPKDSPPDHRQQEQIQHQDQQAASQPDSTNYSLFGRSVIAITVGTTMFAMYLFIIALFIGLTSEIWSSLATLVLPLGGAVLGTRYPLSTVVAVGYLVGLVGILLPFVPLPTDGALSTLVFFEPILAPLIGVAYGLLADYYEFSLLDEVSPPQILD